MEILLLIILGVVGYLLYLGARNLKRREVLVESLLLVTQLNEAEARHVARQVDSDTLGFFAAHAPTVLRTLIKRYNLPQSESNKASLDIAESLGDQLGVNKF